VTEIAACRLPQVSAGRLASTAIEAETVAW